MRTREIAVGIWLAVVAGLVVAMILVGGATRLTDSGLSITEWNFAKQVVPPLTQTGWDREFELYRQTTEYQLQNRGMGLQEFQFIYYWEWGHRFLGKVVGLVYALGFFAFWATGRLKGRFLPTLALFALGGAQGAIGWWMVESGLVGRLDVAPYRLAAHLGMAFLILAGAVWLALDCFQWPRLPRGDGSVLVSAALLALVFIQILAGALVAGSDAGRAYADWPTIGGEWIPSAYATIADPWHALTENHAITQFHHRTLGYLVVVVAVLVAWAGLRHGGAARACAVAVGVIAISQTALGISTVVLGSPLWISLVHQGGAAALWIAAVALLRTRAVVS